MQRMRLVMLADVQTARPTPVMRMMLLLPMLHWPPPPPPMLMQMMMPAA